MTQLSVACAVEGEQYVRHCAAMLHSLAVAHAPGQVKVDYLHGTDTSRWGRRRLGGMLDELGVEIEFHEVRDSWVGGLPVKGFTRKATWYRIFLAELLPAATRVIYLDLDLVVMESLIPLWQMPLGTDLIAAVTNVPPGPERNRARPELGGDPYFNAGVLLLDLDAMRRERTSEQLREFGVENAERLDLRDQDALNAVLHDRRLALHPRWNCMNSVVQWDYATDYFTAEEVAEARTRPAIRHFEGPARNKPWHLLANPDARALYLKHRRQTPWPRMIPSGCTPLNVLRHARRRLV